MMDARAAGRLVVKAVSTRVIMLWLPPCSKRSFGLPSGRRPHRVPSSSAANPLRKCPAKHRPFPAGRDAERHFRSTVSSISRNHTAIRLFQPRHNHEGTDVMLGTILIIILILMLVGALPSWGYSRSWGYGPSGGFGLILIILIILVLLGRV
jgi:hypothetical protein